MGIKSRLKREKRERVAARPEEPQDKSKPADTTPAAADMGAATRRMASNPIGRAILRRVSHKGVVEELSKGDVTDQIQRLDSLRGTGELPSSQLGRAIKKKAPGEMDKAIKSFRKQGKRITVDSLCAEIKSTPGFLSMCERAGVTLEWFEDLARERMKAHGIEATV